MSFHPICTVHTHRHYKVHCVCSWFSWLFLCTRTYYNLRLISSFVLLLENLAYSLSKHEQRCHRKQVMLGTLDNVTSRNSPILPNNQDAEKSPFSLHWIPCSLLYPPLPGSEYDITSKSSALNNNRTPLQMISVSLSNLGMKVSAVCITKRCINT